jgi:hypothetical protein
MSGAGQVASWPSLSLSVLAAVEREAQQAVRKPHHHASSGKHDPESDQRLGRRQNGEDQAHRDEPKRQYPADRDLSGAHAGQVPAPRRGETTIQGKTEVVGQVDAPVEELVEAGP